MKSTLKKIVLAIGIAGMGMAHAATTLTILNVSAVVVGTCSVSTTPVVFSSLNPGTTAQGGIAVECPMNKIYHVTLDAGQHFNGQSRNMAHTSNNGEGQTYTLATYGNELGDDGGTYPAPGFGGVGMGQGGAVVHAINGTITGGTGSVTPTTPGSYTDVVTVTVTY